MLSPKNPGYYSNVLINLLKIPDIVGMITRKKGTVKRLLHKYSNWCLHTEKETIVGRKYLKKEQ